MLMKFSLVVFIFISYQAIPTNGQICTNYYRVFASDSCDSIAQAYRTTIASLVALNPNLNCNSLPYNQLICVPNSNTINIVCQTFYVIASGDTCASISTVFSTSIPILQLLNPTLNCGVTLTPGTQICVSVNSITTTTVAPTATIVPTGQCTNYYRVFPSDSCDSIAAAYGSTTAVLISLNPGLNCASLPYLQLICVPAYGGGSNTCTNYYRVYAVDSCSDISSAFGITVAALVALNPGLNCASLPYNQYICVPPVNFNNVTTTAIISTTTPCFTTTTTTPCSTTTTPCVTTTTPCITTTTPCVTTTTPCVTTTTPCSTVTTTTPCFTTSVAPVCSNYYVVNIGDTCANIIATFGTSLQALQALNPNLNCNSLVFGSVICVPPLSQTCGCFYTVQSGDVCFTIALNNGLSLTQFYALNPGLNCFSLVVNSRVCIRAGSSAVTTPSTNSQCNYFYTVRAGDSCLSIANTFSLSLNSFYQINPTINCQSLTAGQSVCIISSTQCSFSYVTQIGDTCYSLSLRYQIDLARFLAKYNCNNLPTGTSICL